MFKKITGILACDPDGVIGRDGHLPWDYPDELEHFRRTTAGHTLILGHKTFDSMPAQAFQNRLGVVFAHHAARLPPELEGRVVFVSSLDEFRHLKTPPGEKGAFMAGGAEIARLFLENGLVSDFILTRIKKSFAGDTVFDVSLLNGWDDHLLRDAPEYSIHHLIRPEQKP